MMTVEQLYKYLNSIRATKHTVVSRKLRDSIQLLQHVLSGELDGEIESKNRHYYEDRVESRYDYSVSGIYKIYHPHQSENFIGFDPVLGNGPGIIGENKKRARKYLDRLIVTLNLFSLANKEAVTPEGFVRLITSRLNNTTDDEIQAFFSEIANLLQPRLAKVVSTATEFNWFGNAYHYIENFVRGHIISEILSYLEFPINNEMTSQLALILKGAGDTYLCKTYRHLAELVFGKDLSAHDAQNYLLSVVNIYDELPLAIQQYLFEVICKQLSTHLDASAHLIKVILQLDAGHKLFTEILLSLPEVTRNELMSHLSRQPREERVTIIDRVLAGFISLGKLTKAEADKHNIHLQHVLAYFYPDDVLSSAAKLLSRIFNQEQDAISRVLTALLPFIERASSGAAYEFFKSLTEKYKGKRVNQPFLVACLCYCPKMFGRYLTALCNKITPQRFFELMKYENTFGLCVLEFLDGLLVSGRLEKQAELHVLMTMLSKIAAQLESHQELVSLLCSKFKDYTIIIYCFLYMPEKYSDIAAMLNVLTARELTQVLTAGNEALDYPLLSIIADKIHQCYHVHQHDRALVNAQNAFARRIILAQYRIPAQRRVEIFESEDKHIIQMFRIQGYIDLEHIARRCLYISRHEVATPGKAAFVYYVMYKIDKMYKPSCVEIFGRHRNKYEFMMRFCRETELDQLSDFLVVLTRAMTERFGQFKKGSRAVGVIKAIAKVYKVDIRPLDEILYPDAHVAEADDAPLLLKRRL